MNNDHQDSEKVAALRRAVEQRLGRGVSAPSEFRRLSEAVGQSTGKVISTSTLMRIWGYVSSTARPSITTLNALAVYAGYRDFASFDDVDLTGSADVVSSHINVDRDLTPRDHLLLRWSGNHVILTRYIGNGQFVVERSEHSKLAVGDTFTCHLIINDQPLYLDDLVHGSMPPRCYVCGKNHGVRYEIFHTDAETD